MHHPVRATRRPLVIFVIIASVCCGGGSPTTPSQQPPPSAATRVIALAGNLAFGNVPVGTTATAQIAISNTGNATLTVSGMTAPTGYSANWHSGAIPAGGSQPVTISFTPTAAATYNGTITINGDQTSGTNTMAVSGTGTGISPPAQTAWSLDQIKATLLAQNLNHQYVGARGRLTRYSSPIAVFTNGIKRVEDALDHYESWLAGVVSFTRVSAPPAIGIEFVEGGAFNADRSPGCGVAVNPTPPYWDSQGGVNGRFTILLGSTACNDATAGQYSSAVAEHELAHALGLNGHFDGFVGSEGLRSPNLIAVLYNLYANPINVTADELVIVYPPSARLFGMRAR